MGPSVSARVGVPLRDRVRAGGREAGERGACRVWSFFRDLRFGADFCYLCELSFCSFSHCRIVIGILEIATRRRP